VSNSSWPAARGPASARIEELNKSYGTLVLVAESTATAAIAAPLGAVGQVPIRGRQQLVPVYRVVTAEGQAPELSLT